MPTVFLVRHGRTTANAAGTLAGWTPGVGLDDTGREQVRSLARRLARVRVAALVTSPLQRCRETAAGLLALPGPREPRPDAVADERLGECRYGDWTGRRLADLAAEPLWPTLQFHPSAVTFPGPGGESMPDMQHRAVTAVREHNAAVRDQHGEEAVWVAVSHGDVIKAVLADALGMHLDVFQRIVVTPCSVSVVRYAPLRPFVLRINDAGDDLAAVTTPTSASTSDAVVGGTTGVNDAGDARTS